MKRSIIISTTSTLFITVSLYSWRIVFTFNDLAALTLIPVIITVWIGYWGMTLLPWKAHLGVTLRLDSPLRPFLTGRARTAILTILFTFVSVLLLAWQALRLSPQEAILMICVLLISALTYFTALKRLSPHFQNPFAKSFATSIATWVVAIPATFVLGIVVRNFAEIPGSMLTADFETAVALGFAQLPERGSLLTDMLKVFYGYEFAKLWVVIQLRDYPIIAWLFSLDSALISFILCRTSIVVSQFIDTHVLRNSQKIGH